MNHYDDGVDFFRGLVLGVLMGGAIWLAIIWAFSKAFTGE